MKLERNTTRHKSKKKERSKDRLAITMAPPPPPPFAFCSSSFTLALFSTRCDPLQGHGWRGHDDWFQMVVVVVVAVVTNVGKEECDRCGVVDGVCWIVGSCTVKGGYGRALKVLCKWVSQKDTHCGRSRGGGEEGPPL
jgi:hypothetical protein